MCQIKLLKIYRTRQVSIVMLYFKYRVIIMYDKYFKKIIISMFCVTSVVALFLVWNTFSGGGTFY